MAAVHVVKQVTSVGEGLNNLYWEIGRLIILDLPSLCWFWKMTETLFKAL